MNELLITTTLEGDSSFLVITRSSINTGKTKASEVEHTAPIRLIKSPKCGTRYATKNVTKTMSVRKRNSKSNGYLLISLCLDFNEGNMIWMGMKNWMA